MQRRYAAACLYLVAQISLSFRCWSAGLPRYFVPLTYFTLPLGVPSVCHLLLLKSYNLCYPFYRYVHRTSASSFTDHASLLGLSTAMFITYTQWRRCRLLGQGCFRLWLGYVLSGHVPNTALDRCIILHPVLYNLKSGICPRQTFSVQSFHLRSTSPCAQQPLPSELLGPAH